MQVSGGGMSLDILPTKACCIDLQKAPVACHCSNHGCRNWLGAHLKRERDCGVAKNASKADEVRSPGRSDGVMLR